MARGRLPKDAPGQRRTVRRSTRLTPQEAAVLDEFCRRHNITISDYMRGRVLHGFTVRELEGT